MVTLNSKLLDKPHCDGQVKMTFSEIIHLEGQYGGFFFPLAHAHCMNFTF